MMKTKEVRKLDKVAILKKVQEKRIELSNKKMEKYIGKEPNFSLIKSLRKEIAMLLTILNEKEVLSE